VFGYVFLVSSALPPFAVPPVQFPFRALAMRAGRAALGGDREVALAALMLARLARDARGPKALSAAVRVERAAAAKSWLASIAIPVRIRAPITCALEASARDSDELTAALEDAIRACAPWLDDASVAELRAITAGPVVTSR
jgi:hypothetical protein